MEPLTTGEAIAIGSIFATKAVEKAGEKVGESLFEKTGKFLEALKHESPHTVRAIEKATQATPVREALQELVTEVQADPKLADIIQELVKELNSQSAIVVNQTKLAESIKNVFQGSTFHNPTFN